MVKKSLFAFGFTACIILIAASPVTAQTRQFTLSADDWARPRSGEAIVEFQTLRDLIAIWSTMEEGSKIEIRHPGGDEGSLWARELSDWLVALGVPSNLILLTPGYARADQISLLLVPPSGYQQQ